MVKRYGIIRSLETTPSLSLYKGHRFPPEIMHSCVWLYSSFSLSYRDIEAIMAERGIQLTYEPVRTWCLKFGQSYANALRHRQPHPGDKWYLDEVFLTIHGQVHYAWRAVDQLGMVLKVLVQGRRDKKAVQEFFRKLLKGWLGALFDPTAPQWLCHVPAADTLRQVWVQNYFYEDGQYSHIPSSLIVNPLKWTRQSVHLLTIVK